MIDVKVVDIWTQRFARWTVSEHATDWNAQRAQRTEIRAQVVELLRRFDSGEIDLVRLLITLRDNTRRTWDFFGTKGKSSHVEFLGKLLDHLPRDGELESRLRQLLPPPASIAEARARIRAMVAFLSGHIDAGDVEPGSLQARRSILFLSSWWQIQSADWPAYWRPARKLFGSDGIHPGSPDPAETYAAFVALARELIERLAIDDWHDFEGLCRFSYNELREAQANTSEDAPVPEPAPHRHIWLIAPGRGADRWDEHYERGVAAIGWAYLGDLRQYDSKEAINRAMRDRRQDGRNPYNNASTCYSFGHVMKPGDIIFAKRGRKQIIGAGVVIGDYRYEPPTAGQDNPFVHVRDVRWTHRGVGTVDIHLVMKTFTEIGRYDELVQACSSALGIAIDDILRAADIQPDELADSDDDTDEDTPSALTYTRAHALSSLLIDEQQFDDMLDILRERRNIVLQGPPGTGKTYLAARLAWTLIGSKSSEQLSKVQFHQSMTYEDFVRGYRPSGDGFALRAGPFLEFLHRALQDLDSPYVMLIDEINRGNLSRILGELMLLIEPDKRHEDWALTLTYASEDEKPVWVPPNLYLIGTMNTADRSLALVDYALRRRFAFLDVMPAIGHRRFREHLDAHALEPAVRDCIVKRFTKLNKDIRGDANLGPGFVIGHSYFCQPPRVAPGSELDDAESVHERWYRRIIQTEIVPLLREYWFDAPERVLEWQSVLTGDE